MALRREQRLVELGILLIDDEAEFVAALAKVLKRRGFRVATATSGRAGLDLFAQQPFDVVLLDVKMAELDGLAVLVEMRHRAPEIAVVLMTGHLSREDEQTALRTGAFAYVFKPQAIESVIDLIERAAMRREGP
jgi:two-component system response regulator GlrR